jgi:hypothetical protein
VDTGTIKTVMDIIILQLTIIGTRMAEVIVRRIKEQQYSQRDQYWQSTPEYQNRGPPAHAHQVAEQQPQWYPPPPEYQNQPSQGYFMLQVQSQPPSHAKHF